MFSFFKRKQAPVSDTFISELHDEKTFYKRFIHDLLKCQREVFIESPYITNERMKMLYPIIESIVVRGIKVYIITRNPKEHNEIFEQQSELEIERFERLGVHVLLCTGNHHRKIAIIDREILWEGSLNILSQCRSREIMRRIQNASVTMQMFDFLKLRKFL